MIAGRNRRVPALRVFRVLRLQLVPRPENPPRRQQAQQQEPERRGDADSDVNAGNHVEIRADRTGFPIFTIHQHYPKSTEERVMAPAQ